MRQTEQLPKGVETIEAIAAEVHNSWHEQKAFNGFHAPSDCPSDNYESYKRSNWKNQERIPDPKFYKWCDKCHPDMYPYAELSEEVKEYDRVTVRTVLNAQAKTAGYHQHLQQQEPVRYPLYEAVPIEKEQPGKSGWYAVVVDGEIENELLMFDDGNWYFKIERGNLIIAPDDYMLYPTHWLRPIVHPAPEQKPEERLLPDEVYSGKITEDCIGRIQAFNQICAMSLDGNGDPKRVVATILQSTSECLDAISAVLVDNGPLKSYLGALVDNRAAATPQPDTSLVEDYVPKAEEVWDSNSEYMGDDSFSFQRFAGTNIMTREQFMEAAKELNAIAQEKLSAKDAEIAREAIGFADWLGKNGWITNDDTATDILFDIYQNRNK